MEILERSMEKCHCSCRKVQDPGKRLILHRTSLWTHVLDLRMSHLLARLVVSFTVPIIL